MLSWQIEGRTHSSTGVVPCPPAPSHANVRIPLATPAILASMHQHTLMRNLQLLLSIARGARDTFRQGLAKNLQVHVQH